MTLANIDSPLLLPDGEGNLGQREEALGGDEGREEDSRGPPVEAVAVVAVAVVAVAVVAVVVVAMVTEVVVVVVAVVVAVVVVPLVAELRRESGGHGEGKDLEEVVSSIIRKFIQDKTFNFIRCPCRQKEIKLTGL